MERQPVHTVYGGAHLFKSGIEQKLGAIAHASLRTCAPDSGAFAHLFGLTDADLAARVYERTIAKLEREPIEDYRVDFEDGYGYRTDAEEDAHAVAAARNAVSLPPFFGIRIKPLTEPSRARAVRTLQLFLTNLAGIPPNFVVTLPKVNAPAQVTDLVRLLAPFGGINIELMIETPQAIIDASGQIAIPKLIDAAEGRCRGLHFGSYDYTASLDIAAPHQTLTHPACDFARNIMQVATAGRKVSLSDGATNILPVGENVKSAMRLHFENVQRSLSNGFYQGWDLHPAQLPARYAAVYSFFLESYDQCAARLRNFLEKQKQATRLGEVFDDAATVEGLRNFFRRGVNCGAFPAPDL